MPPHAGHKQKRSARKAATPGRDGGTKARLVEKVMWRVSDSILKGVYGPGDSIRETEVSARLGVSRAPVREALRALEHEGMVETIPWRGARVINPSMVEIADLFELLAAMGGVVARLAVKRADDAALRCYGDQIAKFRQVAQAPNPDLFELTRISYGAAEVLAASCGSPMVARITRNAGRPAYWLHRFLMPAPARWIKQSLALHEHLAEALRVRDEGRAGRCAQALVAHTQQLVLRRAREIESALQVLQRSPPATTRTTAPQPAPGVARYASIESADDGDGKRRIRAPGRRGPPRATRKSATRRGTGKRGNDA